VSQLDIKRKIKAKLGAGIALRLRFTHAGDEESSGSLVHTTAAASTGYAEVAKSDEQSDMEMTRL
jgi:hypothetical protein